MRLILTTARAKERETAVSGANLLASDVCGSLLFADRGPTATANCNIVPTSAELSQYSMQCFLLSARLLLVFRVLTTHEKGFSASF